jgi:hypothetical protein
MNAAAWVVTAAGAGLLGLVALDIYRTILHSRGRSEPVTETLTRAVWRLVRDVAFRRSRPARHQLLASTLNPAVHPGQEHRRPDGEVLAAADWVSLPRRKIFNRLRLKVTNNRLGSHIFSALDFSSIRVWYKAKSSAAADAENTE